MKMRKFISLIVLAVYSIVMAHSFIPHHHHSDYAQITHQCEHDEHDAHHGHQHDITGDYCVNHAHKPHHHCNFDEKTILSKSVDLSELYFPSTEISFVGLEKNIQSVTDCYIPSQITRPHCRDVLLRGPPLFS